MLDRTDTCYIIVCGTGTPPAYDIGARHLAKWLSGVDSAQHCPYHFVVRTEGRVEDGRNLKYRGHILHGFNAVSIGVAMVGGQSPTSYCKWGPYYSEAQFTALEQLLRSLRETYPTVKIVGQCELPGQPIRRNPGFKVESWLKAVGLNP